MIAAINAATYYEEWCLCVGVVVGGGQNVPGYNMVYDTRYSLAQLRYGGWWAG